MIWLKGDPIEMLREAASTIPSPAIECSYGETGGGNGIGATGTFLWLQNTTSKAKPAPRMASAGKKTFRTMKPGVSSPYISREKPEQDEIVKFVRVVSGVLRAPLFE